MNPWVFKLTKDEPKPQTWDSYQSFFFLPFTVRAFSIRCQFNYIPLATHNHHFNQCRNKQVMWYRSCMLQVVAEEMAFLFFLLQRYGWSISKMLHIHFLGLSHTLSGMDKVQIRRPISRGQCKEAIRNCCLTPVKVLMKFVLKNSNLKI